MTKAKTTRLAPRQVFPRGTPHAAGRGVVIAAGRTRNSPRHKAALTGRPHTPIRRQQPFTRTPLVEGPARPRHGRTTPTTAKSALGPLAGTGQRRTGRPPLPVRPERLRRPVAAPKRLPRSRPVEAAVALAGATDAQVVLRASAAFKQRQRRPQA